MTSDELVALFKKHGDEEFLKRDRIRPRGDVGGLVPDVGAFLRLMRLYPAHRGDVVTGAQHEEIYLFPDLDVEGDRLPFTEEDIIYLIRCGVRYDSEFNALCMFV